MYLHKEERELFHDVILLTSQKKNAVPYETVRDHYLKIAGRIFGDI